MKVYSGFARTYIEFDDCVYYSSMAGTIINGEHHFSIWWEYVPDKSKMQPINKENYNLISFSEIDKELIEKLPPIVIARARMESGE